MSVEPGQQAPDFDLPDQDGERRSLHTLLERGPVVLFFYPAALTPGCTKESCHFRDLSQEFAAVGAQRVGISVDPVEKQKRFASKYDFDYPLLSDTDGVVADSFGVRRGLVRKFLPVKRTTFVIDKDGTVLERIASETSMSRHADRALEVLAARTGRAEQSG